MRSVRLILQLAVLFLSHAHDNEGAQRGVPRTSRNTVGLPRPAEGGGGDGGIPRSGAAGGVLGGAGAGTRSNTDLHGSGEDLRAAEVAAKERLTSALSAVRRVSGSGARSSSGGEQAVVAALKELADAEHALELVAAALNNQNIPDRGHGSETQREGVGYRSQESLTTTAAHQHRHSPQLRAPVYGAEQRRLGAFHRSSTYNPHAPPLPVTTASRTLASSSVSSATTAPASAPASDDDTSRSSESEKSATSPMDADVQSAPAVKDRSFHRRVPPHIQHSRMQHIQQEISSQKSRKKAGSDSATKGKACARFKNPGACRGSDAQLPMEDACLQYRLHDAYHAIQDELGTKPTPAELESLVLRTLDSKDDSDAKEPLSEEERRHVANKVAEFRQANGLKGSIPLHHGFISRGSSLRLMRNLVKELRAGRRRRRQRGRGHGEL